MKVGATTVKRNLELHHANECSTWLDIHDVQWNMALISEFTNLNACNWNSMVRFHPHPPNCDTCMCQKPMTKSQWARPKDHAEGSQEHCMDRAKGQEPRLRIKSSACMRQTRQTRGPAPHMQESLCMEGNFLFKNWKHNILQAMQITVLFPFATRLRPQLYTCI